MDGDVFKAQSLRLRAGADALQRLLAADQSGKDLQSVVADDGREFLAAENLRDPQIRVEQRDGHVAARKQAPRRPEQRLLLS